MSFENAARISAIRRGRRGLLVVLAIGFVAVPGRAQEGDEDESPEPPAIEYALPYVALVHQESYADFRKHCAERRWSRAFRSIGDQIESPPDGLVNGDDAVLLAWRDRIWRDLAALDVEGRRAFRLFFDAKAMKLLAQARECTEPAARIALLQRVHDAYFVTASGDDATDALAEDAYARGRFEAAARLWRSILDLHPDTDLDRFRLWCRLADAWHGAGRRTELVAVADFIGARYSGRTAASRDGGVALAIEDHLAKRVASLPVAEDGPAPCERLALPEVVAPRWTVEIGSQASSKGVANLFGGMLGEGSAANESTVPDAVLDGGVLYLNHAGQFRAVNADTGEERWVTRRKVASATFGERPRSFVVVAGDRVFGTGMPLTRRNSRTHPLHCLDRTTGRRLWSTRTRKTATHDHDLRTEPIVDGDTVYYVARKGKTRQQWLVALDVADGTLRWEADVGTPAGLSSDFWMPNTAKVTPILLRRGELFYLVGDGGALVAIDRRTGRIEWALRHEFSSQAARGRRPASSAVVCGNVMYFRAGSSRYLYAVDLEARRLLWQRRCDPTSAIVGRDPAHLYLMGKEICARRIEDGGLVWGRRVGGAVVDGEIIVGADHVYAFTGRGLFEMEKRDGANGRVLRDTGKLPADGFVMRSGKSLFFVGSSRVTVLALDDGG